MFPQTSAAARRIVDTLSAKHGKSDGGNALLEFLGLTAASIFGLHGAAALAASPTAALAGAALAGAVPHGASVAGAALSALKGAAAIVSDAGQEQDSTSNPTGKDTAMLHFRSSGSSAVPGAWKADIRIPVSGKGAAIVRIRQPRRASGTFMFCGLTVPIREGRGEIPLDRLRASLSRGGVSFALPSSSPVPGAPYLEV